jgi:hypothetical protein
MVGLRGEPKTVADQMTAYLGALSRSNGERDFSISP